MDKLIIAGREFDSRLFLGTGKFNNNTLMAEAIKASGTEMVTVAMKRVELDWSQKYSELQEETTKEVIENNRKHNAEIEKLKAEYENKLKDYENKLEELDVKPSSDMTGAWIKL